MLMPVLEEMAVDYSESEPENSPYSIRGFSEPGKVSCAVYDRATREHRLWLSRVWDEQLPIVAYIGLNPSTADERHNDPTVGRLQKRAKKLKYGGFIMLNAFSLRSTDPRGLKSVAEPNLPENDEFIRHGCEVADTVVCCWGTHAKLFDRHSELIELLRRLGKPVHYLGETLEGFPKHPLYLPYRAGFVQWDLAQVAV
ncbi:hypothetical protein KOR42_23190 [Thalassoglobus neptunius]|uniref:DUF1643 domain-containing protein n=2 Tax=Thalassoglobus neptunius TaxID=1938619 RepID=A0A5C5XAN1_9PLAN|nr:hypothetical protein KOR42_23190 [Thalassoglobus neptunius]